MNNGLLYLGGLLVLVFAALFAVPNFVDWNGYRGVFEEEASKVLGRDVRVGGAVNLKLLPIPYVRFEKVRIANISGSTGEPFVRADSFTMWLSGPALLRGVLEASEVALDRPELTLAVDDNGSGNWSNIQFRAGDMPFVPRDVMLKSVKLLDGSVTVYNSNNERIAHLGAVNGELSADGLKGPFRFKGTAEWAAAMHEVSFATSSPDADGAFGIKAAARVVSSPNSYLLDGRIAGLSSKPTFAGDLTATVAVPGIEAAASGGDASVPIVDFKSQVTADPLSAGFDNITLTLDNAAEPQTITGKATAAWQGAPRFDVELASKWLDLDRLADAGKSGASFVRLKRLALGLLSSVAGEGAASARINLEQVKVGGETAGGLYIDAARGGGKTRFNRLSASLPGNSRFEFNGELKDEPGKFSFIGNASVSGANLARLKAWAERSGLAIDIAADGAFSADGRIDVGEKRVAITDASLILAGQDLTGDLVLNSETHRMDVKIAAGRLDTQSILPKAAKAVRAKLRAALGLPARDSIKAEDDPLGDSRLRILAGELVDNGDTFRNVDLQLETEGPELRLASSRLTTPAGLEVAAEGRIKSSAAGQPVGTISFDFTGRSEAAARDFVSRFGLETVLGEARVGALNDARLAGLLRLGGRLPDAADVTLDGLLNGTPFKATGEFDAGFNGWRAGVTRLEVSAKSQTLAPLLKLLGRDTSNIAAKQAPATATLLASGIPERGMEVRIGMTGADLAATFSGTVAAPKTDPWTVGGDMTVKSSDAVNLFTLAGFALPSGAAGIPIDGAIKVARSGGEWSLASDRVGVGGSKISGKMHVATAQDGASKFSGDLRADRIVVPPILASLASAPRPVVAGEPALVSANAAAASATAAPPADVALWSDGLFNLAAFGNTSADLKVQFTSLVLSGKLATSDGAMKVSLAPGRFDADDVMANAAGGLLTGKLSLEKKADGVALATNLKLENAKLQSLSPSARGKATFDLEASSLAQSPAGLLAVLTGQGNIDVGAGAIIPGPEADGVTKVADSVLHYKLQNDVRAIVPALSTGLSSSLLPLGERHIGVKIADGIAKLDTIERDGKTGAVTATLNVDLSTLRLNASGQVTASVTPLPAPPMPLPDYTPPDPKGPLPAVVVLYSGRVDDLASIASSVDAGDMQRELAVRQMERNVQQLDLTRRVDQERFRLEKERRRALEEQRLKAIAAERARQEAIRNGVAPPEAAAPESVQSSVEPPPAAAAPTAAPADAAASTSPPAAASEPAPPVEQTQAPQINEPGNTVLTPKITIEPIAPGNSQAEGEAAAAPGAEAAVAPTPIPRPATKPRGQQNRTSSDEIMKSLGGFP